MGSLVRSIVSRKHVLVVALALISVLAGRVVAAESGKSLKLYSPFDEPKPPIPKEMTSDPRLDQRVKVFIKNKNLREILDELSAKTGVKLIVEHETRFERPIIYFHNRPLRDVLTEVSGLYGYHWLVKGEKGAYRYELFESIKHSQRRKSLVQERKEKLDALLLDFTREFLSASPDDEKMKRLAHSNHDAYKDMTDPGGKRTSALIGGLGEGFLSQALASVTADYAFSQFPEQMQADICSWFHSIYEAGLRGGDWDETAAPPTCSSSSYSSARVVLKRVTSGGDYGLPRFDFRLVTPEQHAYGSQWPSSELKLDDYCTVAGWEQPERVISDEAISDDTRITPKVRNDLPGLFLGEIMEAIAMQGRKDIMADYYFQDRPQEPMFRVPLTQLVEEQCKTLSYTCQVDDSLLRFRFNDWYLLPLMEEPPAELLAQWWTSVETSGRLQFDDLVAVACLPERQKWPGLRCIPEVGHGFQSSDPLRLWASLTNAQKLTATSEEGLPSSAMTEAQQTLLSSWAVSERVEATPEALAGAVLRSWTKIRTLTANNGLAEESKHHAFNVKLPSGKEFSDQVYLPSVLRPDELKALLDQRKADREADVIELLD